MAFGWLNRKCSRRRHEQKAQGWSPIVLDTNGNGKRDDYVEPNQPVDPTKDKRINAGFYGVEVNPVDGSIWGAVIGFRGCIIRSIPAPIRRRPLWRNSTSGRPGYGPRGVDIDRNGVVWVALASGHLAQLRSPQVQGPLNGPRRQGKQCPKGGRSRPFAGAAGSRTSS